MRFTVFLALTIMLFACQDLKKEKQLSQVSDLEQQVDSIQKVFNENKNDSIGFVIQSIMDVEFRIRRNYQSDTIDNALGKKVNDYKKIRKKLKPIGKMYGQLERGTTEEKDALKKLKADIENAAGEKAKYDEYIRFETKKVKDLQSILADMIEGQTQCMDTYNRLHKEMYDFSMSLIKAKK